MGEVFVSHASAESVDAMGLVEALEASGIACWVAPRDVGSGSDYTEEIVEALRRASVLVLLASSGAFQSQHVNREVRLAVEMDVPIVPIQLDDTSLPASFSYCLSGSQRLDARGADVGEWSDEVRSTIRRLEREPSAASDPLDVVSWGRSKPDLPAYWGNLVGRDEDLQQVVAAVGEARLVTLVGFGGVGKTRLAIEAARRCEGAFLTGAWLVELAALPAGADSHVVLAAVAAQLEVRLGTVASTALESLCARLRSRRALLVFDNCEHVIEAVGEIVATILRSCAGIHVLATSRMPFGHPAERVILVAPLPLVLPQASQTVAVPGPSAAISPSVQLFVDRASLAKAGFVLTDANTEAVTEICARLDGIPLAIELAAARVRVLSPVDLAERLADRFQALDGVRRGQPDGRGLRATIDWSYRLLGIEQQRGLRFLSSFAGAFDLGSAEVLLADVVEGDPVNVIVDLVDESLLQSLDDGYQLLETVKQFATEELATAGEEPAALERMLVWAEDLLSDEYAGLPPHARQRVARHYDSLAEVVRRAVTAGMGRRAGDIVANASSYWLQSGRFRDGIAIHRLVAPIVDDPERRADLLVRLSALLGCIGDLSAAGECGQEVERLAATLHRPDLLLRLAYYRCDDLRVAGHLDEAYAEVSKGLALLAEVEPTGHSHPLLQLSAAAVACDRGDVPGAAKHLARYVPTSRPEDAFGGLMYHLLLGETQLQRGDLSAAANSFQRANDSYEQDQTTIYAAQGLVRVALLTGDLPVAFDGVLACRELAEQGDPSEAAGLAWLMLGSVALSQGDAAGAVDDFSLALEAWVQSGVRLYVPRALEGLAVALDLQGDGLTAVRLLRAAEECRAQMDYPRLPDEQDRLGPVIERILEAHPEADSLDLDEAIEVALNARSQPGARPASP